MLGEGDGGVFKTSKGASTIAISSSGGASGAGETVAVFFIYFSHLRNYKTKKKKHALLIQWTKGL